MKRKKMKKALLRLSCLACVLLTLCTCLILPTFADSLDGVSEDQMTYGEFYQVDFNYRPPTYQDQIRVEWQPWKDGFVENSYKGAWNSKTQYVYMRVPKDASNNPIGAISIVFEDADERMWLIRDYSVRFQWWRNDHGSGLYEYVSEIVFTNYTGMNGDQNMLCFRWSSFDGYGLYDMNKDTKIKDLSGYIALYYNPGDMYGITTYSNGGSWYGLTNWYTAFGQVDEILTPSYYVGFEDAKQAGYDKGYDDGYYVGGQEGWGEGHKQGVADGITEQANSSKSLKEMIFAVVESPVVLMEGALDFDLFGFNLFGLVKTILTLAVVAAIVTVLIKLVI